MVDEYKVCEADLPSSHKQQRQDNNKGQRDDDAGSPHPTVHQRQKSILSVLSYTLANVIDSLQI